VYACVYIEFVTHSRDRLSLSSSPYCRDERSEPVFLCKKNYTSSIKGDEHGQTTAGRRKKKPKQWRKTLPLKAAATR
jgi:hypothetical protein